jgi:hypothetical protein
MRNIERRQRRQRALGPVVGSRASRSAWKVRALVLVAVGAAGLADATVAAANSAVPTTPAVLSPGSVVQNANGSVTVTASGTWIWPYGIESGTTEGLAATATHPCDNRTGVGWGIVWGDPADPGYSETYTTKVHTPKLSLTVHVGSLGTNPYNADDQVLYNTSAPCGTFVQTNQPGPGDGYDTGVWTATHTYASAADLPRAVCVITYDLGLAKPPGPHRRSFENNDNSVQWGLQNGGAWDTSTMGKNCSGLPPAVAAPPVPPAPVVRTVSNTVPPRAVTKPSSSLAFTGLGHDAWLTALAGALLLLVGLGLYAVEPRQAVRWLLGRGQPPA